jgi:hypothetical protein
LGGSRWPTSFKSPGSACSTRSPRKIPPSTHTQSRGRRRQTERFPASKSARQLLPRCTRAPALPTVGSSGKLVGSLQHALLVWRTLALVPGLPRFDLAAMEVKAAGCGGEPMRRLRVCVLRMCVHVLGAHLTVLGKGGSLASSANKRLAAPCRSCRTACHVLPHERFLQRLATTAAQGDMCFRSRPPCPPS